MRPDSCAVSRLSSLRITARAWKELKSKALIPLGVCLLTIPTVVVASRVAEAVQLRLQRPSFEKLILAIESAQKITVGESPRIIPTDRVNSHWFRVSD